MPNFAMPVSQYMSSPVYAVGADERLQTVEQRMTELGISALVVVDAEENPAGLISRSDLLRVGRREAHADEGGELLTFPDKAVSDLMTKGVVSVSPSDELATAAKRMVDDRLHRVYVDDDGDLVGVLSTRDIMQAIRDKRMRNPISEVMATPPFTIRVDEPLSLAVERLEKARVTGLVVVDESWPVGVFTRLEALAAHHMPGTALVEEAMDPALLSLDLNTPLHRAAAQAIALDTRLIVAAEGLKPHGIVSGLDFVAAIL